ncbi:tol-pal system YbgF family protein, partial [Bacteroidota bacterium]
DHLTFIDTTYQRDKSGGIAKFKRAQIYEIDYVKYDTAMIFYSNVINSLAPKQMKDIAKNKYRILDKYALYHQNIKDNLRLISYIDDPSLFVRDSIAYEEWLERRTRRADSLANLQQTDRQRLTTPGSSSSGAANTIDNTSRSNQRPNYSTTQRSSRDDDNLDELDVIIYPPPKPTVSADSLYKMIAKEQYDLGNLFYTDLNVLDSAYYYYERVLTDYPTNHYYARALYAMGTYYLTLDNKVKADSIFQIIYNEYPNEPVFEAAARQLGKIQSDDEEDPAYALYIDAEEKYYKSEIDSAIQAYMNIYYEHSKSPLAPKALYAVGYILENDFQEYDSAAVIYKLLASDYADSHFTLLTSKKLNNYILVNEPPEPPAISDETKTVDNLNTVQPQIVERDSVLQAIEETDVTQDSLKSAEQKKTKPSSRVNPKLRQRPGKELKEEEPAKQDSTIIDV